MTRNEIRQRLMNLLMTGLLSAGLTAAPAFAASTIADFESVTGSFPGAASGPGSTQFTTREWNTAGDAPPVIANDAAHAAINDYLQLIPEDGSERNSVAFDLTAPGLYHTITVNYDFRITNTTGTPADGLGMSLINTANYGTTGDGANFAQFAAPARSINLGLDNYYNGAGAGDPSNNHVEIGFNGSPNIIPASDLNPATQINLSNGQWHHAQFTLEYHPLGTLASLVLTPDVHGTPGAPVVVFDQALLAGVLPYEARVAFGAATGGADAIHDIDNVQADFALTGPGFNYDPDFSSANPADFTFNHTGNSTPAGFVTGATTYIQLTDADNGETGSVWYNDKQTVSRGFVTEFTFDFPTSGGGADGMGFVIQNIGTGVTAGEAGPGANAFTVEFDSYDNDNSAAEPSAAHITFFSGGSNVLTYDLNTSPLNISDLSNSGPHDVRIEYINGEITLYFDNVKIIEGFAIDLVGAGAIDANGQAWLGFTSRTGGSNEEHNILNWSFVAAVPEPTSFAMLALAGLGVIRRRRNRIA